MPPSSALPLILSLILLALLPLVFGQMFATALMKLHLSPAAALGVLFAIFIGSALNIPVWRLSRRGTALDEEAAIGWPGGWWPPPPPAPRDTLIAVNVGGCLIPLGLAFYEGAHLVTAQHALLLPLAAAVVLNAGICYLVARPIPGVGIAIPALVPPVVAAFLALSLVPDQATPVAFVAGVLGPLLGADLLHLRDIENVSTGIASIGGAGTFDGIALSGIVAAYLA